MNHDFDYPVQETRPILIVEDSEEDFHALQRFLRRSSTVIPVQWCRNGEQALMFLSPTNDELGESVTHPALIVLDLNLPGIDGRELLRQIKQNERLKTIPVVVFTTSNNPKDIAACHQYGVKSYIIKPINIDQLKRDVQTLVEYWSAATSLPNYSEN